MKTASVWLGSVGRARVPVSLAMAVLLTSSSLAHAAEPGPDDTAPSTTPTIGPIASALTPVAADKDYARSVVAMGLDEATAAFLARTRSTVEVVDAHTYVVHHAFPNGATGVETYHLAQAFGGSPEDPPDVTYDPSGSESRYQLRYTLDPAELPDDVRAQLLEGLPVAAEGETATAGDAAHLLAMAALAPAGAGINARTLRLGPLARDELVLAAEAPSTVSIVVDGVVSTGVGKGVDKFVKWADDKGWTKTAKSYKVLKSTKKVLDAVEANDLITNALAKVRSLRSCAEHPTNPLTRAAYAGDPDQQRRILDELDAIESDIREDTVVLFSSLLVSNGSSLIKTAPWLGFITSPATKYIKTTLLSVMANQLRAAEQMVVPCELSFAISGTVASEPKGMTFSGQACSLQKPFEVETKGDILGTITFRPDSAAAGTWSYKGKPFNAPFKIVGSGGYTARLDMDRMAGSLDLDFVLTIQIPSVGNQTNGRPISLTLSSIPLCADGSG